MSNCLIYDFETLSKNPENCVVLCVAALSFDEDRYISDPYTFSELVSNANMIKFDVEEQVRLYKRKIEGDTLEWWNSQNDDARRILKPSPKDRRLSDIFTFFDYVVAGKQLDRVFTRGNTFDPIILQSICKNHFNLQRPYDWWLDRDTRSFIEGLSYGSGLKNDFFPETVSHTEFIHHNPIHDISLDVMRMQLLVRLVSGVE